MNRGSRKEKEKVSQFRTITGASDKAATDCLRAAQWSLEAAIDHFYASGLQASAAPANNAAALDALFQRYKDPDDDNILAEGVGRLCEDLGVDPSDIVMLVLSWHMGAATMCEYSRDEFVSGLQRLGADSVDKLKQRLPAMRAELGEPAKWRDIYNYAFDWAKEKTQKCLQLDVAVGMWQLLFAGERRWPYIDDWCEFLQQQHNRAISKDTWVQLFEFVRSVKPDFSNFDESAAWPYLIDEFVDAKRPQVSAA